MKVNGKNLDTTVLECPNYPRESDQKTQTFGKILPELSRFTASSVHIDLSLATSCSRGTLVHAAHIRQPCIQNQFKAAVGDQKF